MRLAVRVVFELGEVLVLQTDWKPDQGRKDKHMNSVKQIAR